MSLKSSWKTGNFDKSIVKMNTVNRAVVKVGIVTPKQHFRPGRSSIPMAQIYQWMDEGTSDGHVPARPTLLPAFNEYHSLISVQFADNLIHQAFSPSGNITKPLIDIGKTFSKLVKHKIMSLQYPVLSPYTIANRVNKGTTNPLVDTGQLMTSISYSIKYQ